MYLIPTIEIEERKYWSYNPEYFLYISFYIFYWEFEIRFKDNARYWLIAYLWLFELYIITFYLK